MANAYDSQFTTTAIGSMMRAAVWARCAARWAPGVRVLEMNCGTGEDALWLASRGVHVLATDASPQMLRVAHDKLSATAAGASVRLRRLAWEELDSLDEGSFDGALSDFGGLNCVSDLQGASHALAQKLRPGAVAILCIMGPHVPWEWLWFLARADGARAFRRLRPNVRWGGIAVHYPSVAEARRAFAREFRLLRVSALGALLPPPYAEKCLGRYPRVIGLLNRVERRFENRWPLPLLADHYLVELERI